MNEEHSLETVQIAMRTALDFSCHIEERAARLEQGGDFDYCPYCGQELEGSDSKQ